MSINTTKLLSGRAPVAPYDDLDASRYEFLSLSQAEPSLGAGNANAVLTLGPDNARVFTDNLTVANISASGRITAAYFYGDGSNITGISGNLNVEANLLTGNTLSSNVVFSSLTTLGTLDNVYVTGVVSAAGNVRGGNLNTAGDVVATGNVSAQGNVSGTYITGNGAFLTGISSTTGNITFSNTTISTSILGANIIFEPTGNGVVVIANTFGGATGIELGSNTLGQLVSNAVVLTTDTSVTNGIAELNEVLGKLVPIRPPNFPGNISLSITTSTVAARMCTGFTQPDNTTGANKAVAAGTLVNSIRGSTYTTSTISNTGPGDAGTLTVYLNSVGAGNVTFNTAATPTGNGVYGNLVVTNNYDYRYANSSIPAGFWYVFTAQATGVVPSGWNEVYMSDTAADNTNTPSWYYDASTAAAPQFSGTSFTVSTSNVTYSSTIPHYSTGTQFTLGFDVNRLSGNMYPNNGNLLTNTTTAGGAFTAPASLTYAAANISVPLTQNLYVSSGSATTATTANIIAGFGSSATGPSVTVTNSYNSASQSFTPSGTVLYKTGTGTAIDESNIVIGSSIGSGSGNAYRIVNPGTGNTPVYTGTEAQFSSELGPFYTYDATVVGSGSQGRLTFNQTDYSSGAYLPIGPNLSGQGSTQWFTFKFVRSATSKFNIAITGTVGGVWVALPGSVFDTNISGTGPTSDLNGWLNMSLPYGGAGIPGANSGNGGNGSNGCSLGGIIPLNTAISGSYTCTFGTVSSTSTATNEIYVRIRLTAGQSVTALSLQTASN
jgi:hypothetical protein